MVDSPKLHPPSKKVKHLSTSGNSRNYVIHVMLTLSINIYWCCKQLSVVSDQEKDKIMITIKVAAAESKAAINCWGSFLHFATVEQWPARMSSKSEGGKNLLPAMACQDVLNSKSEDGKNPLPALRLDFFKASQEMQTLSRVTIWF